MTLASFRNTGRGYGSFGSADSPPGGSQQYLSRIFLTTRSTNGPGVPVFYDPVPAFRSSTRRQSTEGPSVFRNAQRGTRNGSCSSVSPTCSACKERE
jgi:hypothetical protein